MPQTKTEQKCNGKTLGTYKRKKIHQEENALLKIYEPNARAQKLIKEKLLELKYISTLTQW